MAILDYIRAQPSVIPAVSQSVSEVLQGWQTPSCSRIFLVGSGTSLHALMAMAQSLEDGAGVPVRTTGPTRFLAGSRRQVKDGDLVVVLSQSGASATSVMAAEMAVAAGATSLVLTGEASSPIASVKDAKIVVMPIGPEPIGPKTKGYTASLAALAALRCRLARPVAGCIEIEPDPQALEVAHLAAERVAPELDDVDYVLIAGGGRHEATALEASLKISEVAGLPAAGFDIEEALHGRFHALGPKSIALLVVANPDELEISARAAEVLARRGVRLRLANLTTQPSDFDWVRMIPPLAAPLDTISAILPFQWLAALLALRRGLDPDAMRFPGLSQALAIKLSS